MHTQSYVPKLQLYHQQCLRRQSIFLEQCLHNIALPEQLEQCLHNTALPEQLVSDNGPQFSSTEFSQFLESNRIKHILSAPYHPASNGLAERFMQTLKCNLNATVKEGKMLHHRLAEFLFEYRATPHATINVSPSKLFLKEN